ncbi:hypothetical protein V2G26_013725 [Clonostachys chloroleuca]
MFYLGLVLHLVTPGKAFEEKMCSVITTLYYCGHWEGDSFFHSPMCANVEHDTKQSAMVCGNCGLISPPRSPSPGT